MQTFVTGGTGLLGGAIVRELLAAGHDVKTLVRSPEKAERLLGDLDVEVVVGDLTETDGFGDELAGCEAVFHTAAYFREYYEMGDHWERLKRVNVEGTIDLLAAADRHGVARAVHVSSAGVVGPAADGGPGDETTIRAPGETDNRYFRSKVLAEAAIDEFEPAHDLSVVRILPGWMFGPGDDAPTAGGQVLLDLVHGDLPVVFERGGEVVDARDVARAALAAAERGTPGERYLVGGPHLTIAEIAATVEAVAGVDTPPTVPYPLVAGVARLAGIYSRLTGRPVPLTPQAVATLTAERTTASEKAERELDVTSRPFAETVADTLRWYADAGRIDAAVDIDRDHDPTVDDGDAGAGVGTGRAPGRRGGSTANADASPVGDRS
jgi:dihydroflavonol-4-reductase